MAKQTGLAAVSYILGLVTGIVVLLVAEKKDKFTRFHAMQSILFTVAAWVISIRLGLIMAPFAIAGAMGSTTIMPVLMYGVVGIATGVYGFVIFIIWLFLILKAYSGQTYKLPLIGDWAQNLVK